jgi:hypothetical protein
MHTCEYLGAVCDVFWYVFYHLHLSLGAETSQATIYWAHIGRVIYAATNEQLATLTGPGNKENFTMKWHTRDILLDQQKDVEIIGPVEGMDKIVVEESDLYWSKTRR